LATSSAVSFSRVLPKGTYWYLTMMPVCASNSARRASWAENCGATTLSTLTVCPAKGLPGLSAALCACAPMAGRPIAAAAADHCIHSRLFIMVVSC
jgi:hypothetical protein